MKTMRQIFTALLTAGAMLCSAVPMGASAAKTQICGEFAVLWSREDYTYLRCVNETTYKSWQDTYGYLMLTEELTAALPEGTSPLERGDIITVPDTSGIGGTLHDDAPKDVDGFPLSGIRRVTEHGNLVKLPGTAEKTGSVFDNPQYAFYTFASITESSYFDYFDAEGNPVKRQPVSFVNLRTPGEVSLLTGSLPAYGQEGQEIQWESCQPNDWVYMLGYQGNFLFPVEMPEGKVATVIAAEDGRYLLDDYCTITQADVTAYAAADTELAYGDILYYEPENVSGELPAEAQFGDGGKIEKLGSYVSPNNRLKSLSVTGNADGTVSLKDEEGNAYSYSYKYSLAELGFPNSIDPAAFTEGQIWEFAVQDGKPIFPLRLYGDVSEASYPENGIVVASVTPYTCILQFHTIRQAFGVPIKSNYYDNPVSFSTNQVVAALGAYPKAGDILEAQEDLIMTSTALANAVNYGGMSTADGSEIKAGMLVRKGSIFDKFEPKDFTVRTSDYGWSILDGDFTHQFVAWNSAWSSVQDGDTVTFAMYYDQPAFPLIGDDTEHTIVMAVESVGETDCVIRSGGLAVRWALSELTACLGETPKVGDVLEIHEAAHFIWEDSSQALRDGRLYDTEPQSGMVTKLGNCLEDGESVEYRVFGERQDFETDSEPYILLSNKNRMLIYYFYDTAPYPETAVLNEQEVGLNDTVIFAAYEDNPMIPLQIADYQQGDLDNSGEVDILDVIALNKAVLGSRSLSKAAQRAADLNGNGAPDSEDCLALLKMVLEIA